MNNDARDPEDAFYDFIGALPESQRVAAFRFGTDTADSYIAKGYIEEYDDDAYFSAALEMIADMEFWLI
jgi:hypothetical protein